MKLATTPSNAGLAYHLTHRGNLKLTRYGWLRLTPAYSVHLVSDILDSLQTDSLQVLDPFCGTGTTALACAERGTPCDTVDINPFLVWLAQVKTRQYSEPDIALLHSVSKRMEAFLCSHPDTFEWFPKLHQIEKWWEPERLKSLSHLIKAVHSLSQELSENAVQLLKIAFCRTLIETANVSFGHQSMSFRKERATAPELFPATGREVVLEQWKQSISLLCRSALSPLQLQPRVLLGDSRQLSDLLKPAHYTHIITSPPYPNRMSYIRELRPYMFWLRFLESAQDAGSLDWQAIGGTWGCATSNLSKWEPAEDVSIPFEGFQAILEQIARSSPVLSRYVHKYFSDMLAHIKEAAIVLQPGGTACYIVGNSKFYEVLLPVERIYACMLVECGFEAVDVQVIRKRTSKKELFEFLVTARKPAL